MIRPSKGTLIIKAEVDKGLIIKQLSPDEKFIEYWVYQDGTNGTINSQDGTYAEGKEKTERYLKCVVVCDNDPSHIIKDLEKHFLVKGFIFNDVDYPDLTDYLGRSERHL